MTKSPEQMDFSNSEDQEKFKNFPKEEKQRAIRNSQADANRENKILEGMVELGDVEGFQEASKEFDKEYEKVKEEAKDRTSRIEIPSEKVSLDKLHLSDYAIPDFHDYSGLSDEERMVSSYNKIGFRSMDYEGIYEQNKFVELNGNLIVRTNANEARWTIDRHSSNNSNFIKADKLRKKEEQDKKDNPDNDEIMYKAYDSLMDNNAIRIEYSKDSVKTTNEIDNTIQEELEKGSFIVDILKKLEKDGSIKIGNIPEYYTDEDKRKKREKEINDSIDKVKRSIKNYIVGIIESDLENTLYHTRKRKARIEVMQKQYKEFLTKNTDKCNEKTMNNFIKALADNNNEDSHSAMYREYKRTTGMDIKDNKGVILVEKSSLNLEGKGGEEIDVNVIKVDEDGYNTAEAYKVRDRWDAREDDFSKWYDSVKIISVDEENNLIKIKLSKKSKPDEAVTRQLKTEKRK